MDTTGILRPDELPFEVPYDLELAINELLDAWESDEVMNLDCYLNEVQASPRHQPNFWLAVVHTHLPIFSL